MSFWKSQPVFENLILERIKSDAQLKPDVQQQEEEAAQLKPDVQSNSSQTCNNRRRKQRNSSQDVQQQEEEAEQLKPDVQQQEEEAAQLKPDVQQQEEEAEQLKPDVQQQEEEAAQLKPDVQQQEEEAADLASGLELPWLGEADAALADIDDALKLINDIKNEDVSDRIEKMLHAVGEIEKIKHNDVPLQLPSGFEWSTIDMLKHTETEELSSFLQKNYLVNSKIKSNTLDVAHLRWRILRPNHPSIVLGIRCTGTKKLVGVIAAVPGEMRISCTTIKPVFEIDLMCTLKKLRSKRMAPTLMKEMKRRLNLMDVGQGFFTSSRYITIPICTAGNYFRVVNVTDTTIKLGLLPTVTETMTVARITRLYQVAEQRSAKWYPLETTDVSSARALLNILHIKTHTSKYFQNDAEFFHCFEPRADVMSTYVTRKVVQGIGEIVTNLISFTDISTCVNSRGKDGSIEDDQKLKTAQLHYCANGTMNEEQLLQDALSLTKNAGFDLLTCLSTRPFSKAVLENHRFQRSNDVHFYLYNWNATPCSSTEVGMHAASI